LPVKISFVCYSAPTIVTITCVNPGSLVANVLSKGSIRLSWATIDCAKKYVLQHRQAERTACVSDTINSNIDTLRGLASNTTFEWQVATICRYLQIIISSYTTGANFTILASFGDVTVSHTPDYTKAAAGNGFATSIYPNPATTNATLVVKGMKGKYSVVITNLQGAILWKAQAGYSYGNHF